MSEQDQKDRDSFKEQDFSEIQMVLQFIGSF